MATRLTELEEVVCFLQEPASYPHKPESVHIIQTHISYVAIAPPYVYKLKKPVNFGFLDFSTLNKRRYYCEEEVRLNQRLCTNTYEGTLAISRTPNGLTFGKGQKILDYVVKMKLLPAQYFLDSMLKKNRILPGHIDSIIDKLLPFYKSQEPDQQISSWGQKKKIGLSTDENFEQVLPFIDDLIPSSVFYALRYYTDTFYVTQEALFKRRVSEGHIRDCHGDLRLEHIHLSPEGVCIYDCIEFNERFRYIDIANDIAFLAMDFEHKGFPGLSRYLCEQISYKLTDPDLLTLMPFYKCYRAIVRGKVAAMKSVEKEVSVTSRLTSREEARSFFQLALQYTMEKKEPVFVVFMGRVGTGKSTQAKLLAERMGWPLLSSDVMRKELAGVPLYSRGSDSERKKLYSKERSTQTYQMLILEAKAFLKQNMSVVMDATFSSRQHRDELLASLRAAESKGCFIEITALEETIKTRLALRDQHVEEVSDARLEDFQLLNQRYEAPDASEGISSISSDTSLEKTAFEVLKLLVPQGFGKPLP